jgi:hypothetical protein
MEKPLSPEDLTALRSLWTNGKVLRMTLAEEHLQHLKRMREIEQQIEQQEVDLEKKTLEIAKKMGIDPKEDWVLDLEHSRSFRRKGQIA